MISRTAPAAACFLLLGGAAAAATTAAAPQAVAIQESFRKVVAGVRPAVVSIDSVFRKPEADASDPEDLLRRLFGDPQRDQGAKRGPQTRRITGVGSGVITDPSGYVLTNEHVVGGAEEIRVVVRDPDERTYRGKIVGTDPFSDLAVLKIEARDGPFPYASLGDSDKVQIGDWAIAVGSPFGLEQTVTVGVISALRQSVRVEDRDYSDFFQTDAAINQGNSGGPLLDIDGRVIGVNTAIFSPSGVSGGIGFAIPSNQASRIMKELIARGRIIRGWAGVEIVPLDDVLASQFRVPGQEGALVNSVVEDSPAAEAGLRRGDVIVAFNDVKIKTPGAFVKAVEQTLPGKKAALKLIRAGKEREAVLTVAERPLQAAEPGPRPKAIRSSMWMGAHIQTAGGEVNERFRLPRGASGVIVLDVDDGSWAEEIGLQRGDLIQSLNGRQTRDAADFAKKHAEPDLEKGVVLDVTRRGRPIYLTYRRPR
ncbi:MAG TPA: Do family serine endopeptidase [Elusimicrobiota bacterium]|nr:Do family serine endopeptidase [Elusimicrobiota bacterium]